MSGAYVSVIEDKLELHEKTNNGEHNLKSGRRSRAAGVILGLLCFILLVVILALVAHNRNAISFWNQHQMRLNENENLTATVMQLQARFNNFTETRKQKSGQTGPCQLKWIEVNRECFYISPKGVVKNWKYSKMDCKDRGGRLVTIKTRLRLQVLGLFHSRAWIGLSQKGPEGLWKWEDGTDLESDFWMEGEPNDQNANEDCGQLTVEDDAVGFNDNKCSKFFPYICEASG